MCTMVLNDLFSDVLLRSTCRPLTDDIRLPFERNGEKRKLRAARGSGITATSRPALTTYRHRVAPSFRAERDDSKILRFN